MRLSLEQPALADQNLFLFSRPLHPELFHITLDKRCSMPRYDATVWIVGTAHVVSVTVDDACLTEMTGVSNDLLPKRGLIETIKLRGERNHDTVVDNAISYMVTTQVEQMSVPVYRQFHRDVLRMAQKRGLLMSYQQWSEEGLPAFAYVEYEAGPEEFRIDAFHAFPRELSMIKTQSVFELI